MAAAGIPLFSQIVPFMGGKAQDDQLYSTVRTFLPWYQISRFSRIRQRQGRGTRLLNPSEITCSQEFDPSEPTFSGLTLKDSAIHYAEMELKVFPLKKKSKKPQIINWPEKATTDTDQINRWWTRWPSANIAILTGEKSGIFVVDVDPKNGGNHSLAQLLHNQGDFPITATQKTGSGGEHIFFKTPGLIKTRRNFPDLGIDICANQAYIVAAPSIHPNGNQYRWITDLTHLSASPVWLNNLLVNAKKVPVSVGGKISIQVVINAKNVLAIF